MRKPEDEWVEGLEAMRGGGRRLAALFARPVADVTNGTPVAAVIGGQSVQRADGDPGILSLRGDEKSASPQPPAAKGDLPKKAKVTKTGKGGAQYDFGRPLTREQAAQVLFVDGKVQEKHHKKISFQDELRALLRKHNLDWDERYLWD